MSSRRSRNNNRNSNSSTCSNSHLIGTAVSVVQKQDQGTGHLTSGTIAEILTNSSFHPRGIKVRLEDGTVGRISSSSTNTTPSTFDNYHGGGHGAADYHDYHDAGNDGPAAARLGHTTTLADFVTMPKVKASSLPKQNSLHAHEHEHEHEREEEDNDAGHNADADWACPVCTFVNSGLLPECEMCQTRRE